MLSAVYSMFLTLERLHIEPPNVKLEITFEINTSDEGVKDGVICQTRKLSESSDEKARNGFNYQAQGL